MAPLQTKSSEKQEKPTNCGTRAADVPDKFSSCPTVFGTFAALA